VISLYFLQSLSHFRFKCWEWYGSWYCEH